MGTTRRTVVDSGGLLIEHDQLAAEAYIVSEGCVELERETAMGPLRLASLGAGGIIGEMSFLEAKPRLVNARANGENHASPVGPPSHQCDDRQRSPV